jgi:drug/metabolite transporter (DMT)-like permease
MAAYGLLAFPVFFWGGAYRATAVAGDHASSTMAAGLRCAVAALLLAAIVPIARVRLPQGRAAFWSAVTGVLMVTLFFEGLVEGTVRAGPGNAAVLTTTSPLFVAIFARAFLGEHLSALRILGLLAGFGGIVLMVWPQLGDAGDDLAIGIAWSLAGAVGWAVGTIVIKRMTDKDPALDLVGLTTIQYMLGGGLLMIVALAIDGTSGTDWSSGDLWGATAYMAVGSSAIATIAFFSALKRLSATVVSAATILVPVVAVAIEAVRGVYPETIVLGGIALAVGGVALVVLAPEPLRELAPSAAT